ncbi:hypothetical protein [Mesorhizobium sp. M1B.F.Ca.ET.045.04.1.1]|uniref:hypothetical protein n=1 Tax=Mesorhizobium sp. M1B.F.Ca.ET.045.04.1.1 TaxID=2493673 RepID=UPI000F74FDF6|nr:hypothetical protein [Mesorhizobium sp. M1B.F.Ca.ET.045.04.1.1]AZO29452.1 hypothetical protein EJ071_20010 [Mesorhizobium sp. M1B.F.Ca.ET.045.04.1.1]
MMNETEVGRCPAGITAARAEEMRLEILLEDRVIHPQLARQLHQVDPGAVTAAVFVAMDCDFVAQGEQLADAIDRQRIGDFWELEWHLTDMGTESAELNLP